MLRYFLKKEEGIPEEPYKRCGPENREDDFDANLTGILLGFEYVIRLRNHYLDLVTLHDTMEEIEELIRRCGGDPKKFK